LSINFFQRPRSLAPEAAKWRDQIFYYLTIVPRVQPCTSMYPKRLNGCSERRPITLRAVMVLLHASSFAAGRLRVGKRVGGPTSGLKRIAKSGPLAETEGFEPSIRL